MYLPSYLPMHLNYGPGPFEANELHDLPYWSDLYTYDMQATGKCNKYHATRAKYDNLMRI